MFCVVPPSIWRHKRDIIKKTAALSHSYGHSESWAVIDAGGVKRASLLVGG